MIVAAKSKDDWVCSVDFELTERRSLVRADGIDEFPALSNNASLLETEVAAPVRSWSTDDDVIHQLEQQDPAGFQNPAGEPQIRFRRGGIPARMIEHRDEGVGRVSDHGLKDFSWVAERFVGAALANRTDLNEVLLGVEKTDTQAFAIQKAHLRTKLRITVPSLSRTLRFVCSG
jgi:hypothetical protein